MTGKAYLPHAVSPKLIDSYKHAETDWPGPYGRWIRLIYGTQALHNCTLLEAQRLVLANRHVRRWVERAINAGNPSRKEALAHIRVNGNASLIVREAGSFNFRIPQQ
jgi:hypothetical protein